MGIEGQSISLPYPYPDLKTYQWDSFALLRNLQFLADKITNVQLGQLMPTGGIVMMRSGGTCPAGFSKVSDAGLAGRFLRLATTAGGTGGTSAATLITTSGSHTHHTSIPTSTRLVTSAATGTTFLVSTSTHIHTISSSGGHTHHATITPLYIDVILCQKD